ncbi:MAG TPA: discoidin domain-containing protein [Tepidisphaeraceae bacterium]|nr:discoidin domain-containing protein [Tepidisphaeraceae bacterium]
MKQSLQYFALALIVTLFTLPSLLSADPPANTPTFVRLSPLPQPRVIASSQEYPGGAYKPANLLDGNPRTEYSSDAKGTQTFLEFDFAAPVSIAGFRHQDRNDPATVAASELNFFDAAGQLLATVPVTHVNQRAGLTLFALPSPITAQRVRWQVTKLGPAGHGTVGGAEIAFLTAGQPESAPRGITLEARAQQLLARKDNALVQPLKVTLDYPYAQPISTTVHVEGLDPKPVNLKLGAQSFDFDVPAVDSPKPLKISVDYAAQTVASQTLTLKPVRKLLVYLLPHSHVDIGYTALQADVVKKQNSNIATGLRLIEATKSYPQDARFKWNVEVLWPVENYLSTATPEQRDAFMAAAKAGSIGFDALYGNLLTGLCRPEELLRMCSYATRISDTTGLPIESAMISDVPGYTWSTVSALAHAGVKYFSFAPNYFDRMGGTMVKWQNKPFWWQAPDGKSRLLCWCPSRGYALGHLIGDGEALARFMPSYLEELDANAYPYEITHLRWNVHGDNGSPDEKLSDVVRDWNARYVYPRLVIATTAEAFRAFEKRYGDQLPVYSGDYTPYWEDGAGSSASETALNRATAERLVQTETLWVLRNLPAFPAARFHEAWRNVLLYSEHTWGAHNSISQPDLPFVKDQWKVKQAFALDADQQSQHLLTQALGTSTTPTSPATTFDVYNTCSWQRTDLVTLAPALSTAGDRVVDVTTGQPVPSQRLSTGQLAFLAANMPPLSARRFRVEAGAPFSAGQVKCQDTSLIHPDFSIRVNPQTGAIASLQSRLTNTDLVDPKSATALNDFFYLPGSNVKDAKRNGTPRITVKESGPLVASLLVESDAPGCSRLVREIRVVDGIDRVEMINLIDKQPVRAKEGLHFGFGFNVPDSTVRFDVGWATVRPNIDQIPASCKNWFSVQRWVDLSNDKFGLTWATVDAPLVQLGGMTANLIGSQTDHRVWIENLQPSSSIYAWVMNNHWHTNYRADQQGPTLFRFAIRPHLAYSPLDAARFGTSYSQPLLVAPASSSAPSAAPFKLSSDNVLVTALKPSDDGKAWIIRLFGASGTNQTVSLQWNNLKPRQLWLSNTSEKPLQPLTDAIQVPGSGIVTLRVEFSAMPDKSLFPSPEIPGEGKRESFPDFGPWHSLLRHPLAMLAA